MESFKRVSKPMLILSVKQLRDDLKHSELVLGHILRFFNK